MTVKAFCDGGLEGPNWYEDEKEVRTDCTQDDIELMWLEWIDKSVDWGQVMIDPDDIRVHIFATPIKIEL